MKLTYYAPYNPTCGTRPLQILCQSIVTHESNLSFNASATIEHKESTPCNTPFRSFVCHRIMVFHEIAIPPSQPEKRLYIVTSSKAYMLPTCYTLSFLGVKPLVNRGLTVQHSNVIRSDPNLPEV